MGPVQCLMYVLSSPRIANDDQYASNVPDSLSSSSASSLDTAVSGEGSEESGRSLMNSAPIKATRVKGESLHTKDGGERPHLNVVIVTTAYIILHYMNHCPDDWFDCWHIHTYTQHLQQLVPGRSRFVILGDVPIQSVVSTRRVTELLIITSNSIRTSSTKVNNSLCITRSLC